MGQTNVLDLIKSIGAVEASITDRVFISPVFTNTKVATKVSGIVYTFSIPQIKEGWYKVQPVNTKTAKIVDKADLADIEGYLKLLGQIRVTLVMKRGGVYHGIPDKSNKYGLKIEELLPIYLGDDSILDFDRIIARYDGANFWFDRVDQGNDPAKADYLRTSMLKLRDPRTIKMSGLMVEERLAYTLRLTLDKKLVVDQKKDTIKRDVEFAGGSFVNFVERTDHYSVTYTVDGHEYTSHIAKDPRRMVISAGICLAGNDRRFDLKSLITVIREAQHEQVIHHYHLR